MQKRTLRDAQKSLEQLDLMFDELAAIVIFTTVAAKDHALFGNDWGQLAAAMMRRLVDLQSEMATPLLEAKDAVNEAIEDAMESAGGLGGQRGMILETS